MNITKHKPSNHVYSIRSSAIEHTDSLVHLSPNFNLTQDNLPDSVDLRPMCSPVETQGDIGSCSGQAFAGAIEFLENSKKAFGADSSGFFQVSRLFVYYNERLLELSTEYAMRLCGRTTPQSFLWYLNQKLTKMRLVVV
jgi:hypothetical protein